MIWARWILRLPLLAIGTVPFSVVTAVTWLFSPAAAATMARDFFPAWCPPLGRGRPAAEFVRDAWARERPLFSIDVGAEGDVQISGTGVSGQMVFQGSPVTRKLVAASRACYAIEFFIHDGQQVRVFREVDPK